MNIKSLLPRPRSAAERRLRQELAGYDSPAHIADLMATVDRYEGPEAEKMRSILSGNLMRTHHRSRLVH